MTHSDPEPEPGQPSDWLVAAFLTEASALLIALVTPVTPSKTASRWTPADLFLADPSYFQKVLASFVAVNLLIAILGLVAWLTMRRE